MTCLHLSVCTGPSEEEEEEEEEEEIQQNLSVLISKQIRVPPHPTPLNKRTYERGEAVVSRCEQPGQTASQEWQSRPECRPNALRDHLAGRSDFLVHSPPPLHFDPSRQFITICKHPNIVAHTGRTGYIALALAAGCCGVCNLIYISKVLL